MPRCKLASPFARVFHRPFDNFAAAEYALEKCRGDWAFSIDADERPTPPLIKEIRRRLPEAKQNAFRIPIRSRIFGRRFRFSGTQDDRFIRLVRKGTAHWEGRCMKFCEPRAQLASWLAG